VLVEIEEGILVAKIESIKGLIDVDDSGYTLMYEHTMTIN